MLTNGPLTAKREDSSTTHTATDTGSAVISDEQEESRGRSGLNPCHADGVQVAFMAAERVPNTQGTIKLGFTQSGTRCVNCN